MKLWMHFKSILEPFATEENLMEILDVNLTLCNTPSDNELMRLQDFQKKIN